MNLRLFLACCIAFAIISSCGSKTDHAITETTTATWPDSLPWWKRNNLRVIQVNLPGYEGGLNPDSLVDDLVRFSANTLIINAGGIMAFYPTKLESQYTNPHMNPTMLGEVVRKCHEHGIKVITRFDFSRAHESIFKVHPDWFYVSPKGERIINDDMVVVSIDAPYEQQVMFDIVNEVLTEYPVDGIFINMPGYQVRNPYVGVYHGIDQNDYSRKRFAEFSHGKNLPKEENADDVVFKEYEEFKKTSIDDLMRRMHELIKSKGRQIAICTYGERYIDIIRHESQSNTSLPYWPYTASDNVNNAVHSYPDHIISNASIQQISFQSRYNAVEPEEVAIRLYENIANGSGLDLSLMGDFQDYEDERNYKVFEEVYSYHKKFESYFGRYTSPATIAVIAPGAWPSGEAAQEYRGIQLMLKEAHLPYDIIEDKRLEHLESALKQYKLIIFPEIAGVSDETLKVIQRAMDQGTNLIATNRSFTRNPEALLTLFGAKAVNANHDGAGYYLAPDGQQLFTRFNQQKLLSWKFNLGLYDFTAADSTFLPILTPGRPGPPEIIGGHTPTAYKALGIKNHASTRAALLPINLGKLYYVHGYEQHKNILLDVIDHVYPQAAPFIQTNAPGRVEIIPQYYRRNIPENYTRTEHEGMIVHLINLTGFSNTYFEPLPVYDIEISIATGFKPTRIFALGADKSIDFTWAEDRVTFKVNKLHQAAGIVLER
jgi:hypothetical protein